MRTNHPKEQAMSDKELIRTLKTAVATSKRLLLKDGLLLILWGSYFFVSSFWKFLVASILISSRLRDAVTLLDPISGFGLALFTIYYVFIRNKHVHTNTAISTRFVWIGIIIAQNLNVIITKHYLQEVNFDLLVQLQMTLIGFALFITSGIYRYYLLTASAVLMWIAAAVIMLFDHNLQRLFHALTHLICFVVPGVIMYLASKKQNHV